MPAALGSGRQTVRRRVRRGVFAAVIAIVIFFLAGCGGTSSSNDSPTSTTSAPIGPQSPSTLPAPSTTAASPYGALCSLFADLYGVENLQPKDTGNWSAEQQRIGVDAQREAAILNSMKGIAPQNLVAPIQAEVDYANFVADNVPSAATYAAAQSVVNGYAKKAELTSATTTLSNWKKSNCPR
ncbi:MAG: hypothetical protein RLZZ31_1205 [Actinomycetota bacterium]|jgi:PBP1b-binding outer membrane lipoprotein LpoB